MAGYDITSQQAELERLLGQLHDGVPWENQILEHNTGLRLHLRANGELRKIHKDGSDGDKIGPLTYAMHSILKVNGLIRDFLRTNA